MPSMAEKYSGSVLDWSREELPNGVQQLTIILDTSKDTARDAEFLGIQSAVTLKRRITATQLSEGGRGYVTNVESRVDLSQWGNNTVSVPSSVQTPWLHLIRKGEWEVTFQPPLPFGLKTETEEAVARSREGLRPQDRRATLKRVG